VGVGDIGEVPGDAWTSGDTASCDDGRGAGREHDTGVVIRLGVNERDARAEQSGDRVGVGDNTRSEHEVCDVHGAGKGGAHGMRGDRVGVGDISEVPGDKQSSGDTASCDDGRAAGRERDTGVVIGLGANERDETAEQRGDRIVINDDTRGEHGACDVHGVGTREAHGMRGDRVGVGDISEVPGDEWRPGDAASCDDGRAAGRERDTGVVIGLGVGERDAKTEQRRDRVGVSDNTRGEHGACDVHRADTGGAHGMQGDRVEVGDISEVSGDAWILGDTASCDDGRAAGREHDTGVVGGLGVDERDARAERRGNRVGVGDDTRGEHGACDVHRAGTRGAHGMRGDRVGIGDIC